MQTQHTNRWTTPPTTSNICMVKFSYVMIGFWVWIFGNHLACSTIETLWLNIVVISSGEGAHCLIRSLTSSTSSPRSAERATERRWEKQCIYISYDAYYKFLWLIPFISLKPKTVSWRRCFLIQV